MRHQIVGSDHGITPDDTDKRILACRTAARERTTPQVGDWLRFADGTTHRISHDWGEALGQGLQTSAGGSWYLGDGYSSFSGQLDPCTPRSELRDSGETKPARFWFFHRAWPGPHCGVYAEVECRVWETDLAHGHWMN